MILSHRREPRIPGGRAVKQHAQQETNLLLPALKPSGRRIDRPDGVTRGSQWGLRYAGCRIVGKVTQSGHETPRDPSDGARVPTIRLRVTGHERIARNVQIQSRANDQARATVWVAPPLEGDLVDLSGRVEVRRGDGLATQASRDEHILFAGHAIAAGLDTTGSLRIEATAGVELSESSISLIRTSGVHPSEEFYLIARLAGFPSQRIQAPEAHALPTELIAVEVPLQGVSVQHPTKLLGVDLLPLDHPRTGEASWGPFTPFSTEIERRWGRPTARARVAMQGQLMYEVEQRGLELIARALDAAVTTAVYGACVDPWSRDRPFLRSRLRARPTSLPVVFSIGVATGRQWIHALPNRVPEDGYRLFDDLDRWADLTTTEPSDSLTSGLRAIRDAADESRQALDRCHAISTVLEYYAAEVKMPRLVQRASQRGAVERIVQMGLSTTETEALVAAVQQTNAAPLMARVRRQAELDGVPVGTPEWELLARLRRTRNAGVHGRTQAELPDEDELRWGVSIVSRLLLYRWVGEGLRRT